MDDQVRQRQCFHWFQIEESDGVIHGVIHLHRQDLKMAS